MEQKTYKLLGYPLGHSLSPFIHERLFELSGKNSLYDLYAISQQDFDENVVKLLKTDDGLNVTIPYKVDIMKHLDKIDEKARLYNAVNTIHCGEETVGYNTDCYGFLEGIRELGTSLSAGPVLLLGSGGAANMIASEVVLAGSPLTIAVRPSGLPAATRLRDRLITIDNSCCVNITTLDEVKGRFHLLVNATPVGMYPNAGHCPVSEEVISQVSYVFDLIYNPTETVLLKLAKKHNIPAENGISMLVWQAVYAHKIWYQAEFKKEDIDQLIADCAATVDRDFVQPPSERASQR